MYIYQQITLFQFLAQYFSKNPYDLYKVNITISTKSCKIHNDMYVTTIYNLYIVFKRS